VTKDFADFLASLNSEGAVYVVIGGMAVLSYVPYRTTRDLDVLIEPNIGGIAFFCSSSWISETSASVVRISILEEHASTTMHRYSRCRL